MKNLMVGTVAISLRPAYGEPMRWSQQFHEGPLVIEGCRNARKLSADGKDSVIPWSNP